MVQRNVTLLHRSKTTIRQPQACLWRITKLGQLTGQRSDFELLCPDFWFVLPASDVIYFFPFEFVSMAFPFCSSSPSLRANIHETGSTLN